LGFHHESSDFLDALDFRLGICLQVQDVRSIVIGDQKAQLREQRKVMLLVALESGYLQAQQCKGLVGRVPVYRILVGSPADIGVAPLMAVLLFVTAETAAHGFPSTGDRYSVDGRVVCLRKDLVGRWDRHLGLLLHSRGVGDRRLDQKKLCRCWRVLSRFCWKDGIDPEGLSILLESLHLETVYPSFVCLDLVPAEQAHRDRTHRYHPNHHKQDALLVPTSL
jgi:hypothetical protein